MECENEGCENEAKITWCKDEEIRHLCIYCYKKESQSEMVKEWKKSRLSMMEKE